MKNLWKISVDRNAHEMETDRIIGSNKMLTERKCRKFSTSKIFYPISSYSIPISSDNRSSTILLYLSTVLFSKISFKVKYTTCFTTNLFLRRCKKIALLLLGSLHSLGRLL